MTTKSLGALTVDLILETAGFESGMDKSQRIADQKLRRMEQEARTRAKAIESAFSEIAGTIGKVFVGVQVAQFANQTVQLQGRLEDLSKSTEISVTKLAGLEHAARMSGTNLDAVASAVNKLSVNMGKDAEKFAALGVTAKEPIAAFAQLADILRGIDDPQKRAAVAADALGKSWAELAPLLSEGGQGIEALVAEGRELSGVTDENNRAAAEFGDNLEKLKTGSYGLANTILNPLLPALNDLISKFNEAARTGNLFGWAITGGDEEDNAAEKLTEITGKLERMRKTRDELSRPTFTNQLNDIVFGDVHDLNIQIGALEKQAKYLQSVIDLKAKANSTPAAAPSTPDKAISDFLGTKTGSGNTSTTKAISEGQRLIDQLEARLLTTQKLTEVERLQAEISFGRYSTATPAERTIALALAEQIDRRTEIARQLDEEIAAARELSQVYDQQAARLQQMIAQTPAGQALSKMQDEALIESAFLSGQIDTSTYDQLISKLHEVRDEGKDAFADLQSAIEGWGQASADAFVEFAFTGKASFSDMATSILKDLAKMAIYQNVTKPLADGAGAWIKSLLPSANGNVFSDAPGLHQYVNTVQSSPKVFSYGKLHGFANGGVFAEAGEEAVMPLKRDANGRLGVSGSALSGVSITINNTVSDQAQATVQPRMNNGKLELEVLIQSVIANDRQRNGPITQGLAHTFGLARAV